MLIKIDNSITLDDLKQYNDFEIIGFLTILLLHKEQKINYQFLKNYYLDQEKIDLLLKKINIFSQTIEIKQKKEIIFITKKEIITKKIIDLLGITKEIPKENVIDFLFYHQKQFRKNIKLNPNNKIYYQYKVINDYNLNFSRTELQRLINIINTTKLNREQIIFCLDYTINKSYTNNLNFDYLEKMIESVEKIKDNTINNLLKYYNKKNEYIEPSWKEEQIILSAEEKKLVEEYINE